MLMVLILAIGCFAGCGEDDKKADKNNSTATATPDKSSGDASGDETKKEMTFTDVSETVSKLASGAEIDVKFSIAIKPVFDEEFTEEIFTAQLNGLAKKNSKGLYEIPMSLSGVATDKTGKLTLKLADKNISDMIFAEEKVYLNVKSFFEFYVGLMGGAIELAWPAQNEYIELVSFMEYMQELNQQVPDYNDDLSADIEWSDEEITFTEDEYMVDMPVSGAMGLGSLGMFEGIDEETKQQIIDLFEVIKTAIPEATLKLLEKQFTDLLKNNNVLIFQKDHISFKLDKSNLKGTVLAVADIVRVNGADLIDSVMQAIIKSDKFDEEMKASMTEGYDKEQVKQDLQEMFDAEQLGTSIDATLTEIGDTHIYVTLGADDNSATFLIDVLLDGLAQTDSELGSTAGVSQVGIVFEVSCKVKDVTAVSAPTSVLTEAELNTLFMLFA